MQDVESDERVLIDRAAAEEEKAHLFADNRRRRGYVRANGDGPIGKLVPGSK